MRFDAMLIDQPAEHVGRAIGTVAHKLDGMQTEAFHRAFDHALRSQNLGLPDRSGRFDIDDDRVVDIDQIVGGVSEEGLSAMGSGPARRRIGRRDELWRNLGRRTERSIVENGQILFYGASRSLRRKSLLALYTFLPVRLRLDQAGIDRKSLAADQALIDAAPQHCLKEAS